LWYNEEGPGFPGSFSAEENNTQALPERK